ncbi:hypothetical protein DPMN_108078 [Dreissena polymorpha]|uniref:Uncharacterized protein n=1 Tax=Dreissena polymorpha TaxID=45954 RepID=A0A9D4K7Y2_DREPO|nr:hypothetical protein DPMN_108078 [Dreissena polymorpha]
MSSIVESFIDSDRYVPSLKNCSFCAKPSDAVINDFQSNTMFDISDKASRLMENL